jgi:transcriptional regulator with XRE-family HTH domain
VGKPPETHKVKLLGANVRRIRTLRGLTQEGLAERADLHHRSIQKIEAGEMTILVTTLYRLKDALKCQWEDLLGK